MANPIMQKAYGAGGAPPGAGGPPGGASGGFPGAGSDEPSVEEVGTSTPFPFRRASPLLTSIFYRLICFPLS